MVKKDFNGTKVGYARVSSYGQSLEVQLDNLSKAGCSKVFKEKCSGKTVQQRKELLACLEYVREGDVLYVCKLDRLARNVRDLLNLSGKLEEQGVGLHVLDQNLDTTTSSGRLLFNMLGVIAEFENDLRKERQLEGIKKAQDKGIKFGAKKKLSTEQVEMLRSTAEAGGKPLTEIAKDFGISRASLYRYLDTS
jgi:DNA invertase Pin-like site-specific DNA recombinase